MAHRHPLHMCLLQASRWKQLWRPHLVPVALQPDQLSFLFKTRARDAMRWTTMNDDPEGVISSQVRMRECVRRDCYMHEQP